MVPNRVAVVFILIIEPVVRIGHKSFCQIRIRHIEIGSSEWPFAILCRPHRPRDGGKGLGEEPVADCDLADGYGGVGGIVVEVCSMRAERAIREGLRPRPKEFLRRVPEERVGFQLSKINRASCRTLSCGCSDRD